MKKLMALILALVCVLGMVGCSDTNMTFDIGEVSKINIKSGLTGDEVNIADNEFIQSITENINSLRFEKTSAADGKVGYAYMLTWFDAEDNQIASITITDENGYQISHDGYHYKVGADLSIDTELIEEMLNTAFPSEPKPADGECLEPPDIEATKQLTLEKVMELSAKGEELTWSDFEQYIYEDIGSGLYIYCYDIDSNFELRIGISSAVEPMYIRLVSKANRDNYIDIRTENVMEFIENDVVLKEPPALNVVCNEVSIEALRGTSSWMYQNEDGTRTGIESDSMHPLQAKEYMTPLSLMPSYLSHIDPFTAYLQFHVIPDEVRVRCWSEECWGQYDAQSEDIPVKILKIDSNIVGYGTNFIIDLKDGNYIYEVIAEWNRSENYGGNAYYSFYTVTPDMEPHPIEDTTTQTNDLCGYPLSPTE